MKVISSEIAIVGNKRGRICLRSDGYFHAATETYHEACEDHDGYWLNDYPPSGILSSREDALNALWVSLGQSIQLQQIEPIEFELTVGPWPEPVIQIK